MQICQDNPFLLINSPPSWQWEYLMDSLIPYTVTDQRNLHPLSISLNLDFSTSLFMSIFMECNIFVGINEWTKQHLLWISPRIVKKNICVPDSIIARITDFYPCEIIWFFNQLWNVFEILKILCWIFIHCFFMFAPITTPETVRCRCPQNGYFVQCSAW